MSSFVKSIVHSFSQKPRTVLVVLFGLHTHTLTHAPTLTYKNDRKIKKRWVKILAQSANANANANANADLRQHRTVYVCTYNTFASMFMALDGKQNDILGNSLMTIND